MVCEKWRGNVATTAPCACRSRNWKIAEQRLDLCPNIGATVLPKGDPTVHADQKTDEQTKKNGTTHNPASLTFGLTRKRLALKSTTANYQEFRMLKSLYNILNAESVQVCHLSVGENSGQGLRTLSPDTVTTKVHVRHLSFGENNGQGLRTLSPDTVSTKVQLFFT